MKVPDLKFDEKNVPKDAESADLDTAIALTQFGRFHIFLIAVGGFCFMCSGFEYGLQAYSLPYAQCDLRISTAEVGIINASFLGGSILCTFIWGALADTVGRKKVIWIAMLLDGVATILASWSPNYIVFSMIRFVSGFMCGAPGCLLFSYVGEFCSDRYRSRSVCTIGFCWTLAWLLLPILSWLIIPSSLSFSTAFLDYNTWRLFVATVGVPNLIGALIICNLLTETPKYLFVHGQQTEALEILKLMYHKNTGNPPEKYPVKKLLLTCSANAEESSNQLDGRSAPKTKTALEIIALMGHQMKAVFTPPILKKTTLCSFIYLSNFFGYYGLGLWLPELFNRFEAYYAQHPNETVSVCELSELQTFVGLNSTNEEFPLENITGTCQERSLSLAVFSNTFIIGIMCCVGNLLAIILTNKVGGRLLSFWTMLIAGGSSVVVYFSRSDLQIVLVNCLFMGGIGTAMVTIGSCVVNIFPTSIRGMGVCIGILFGRLGAALSNLIFGMLLDISCEVPIFLLGGIIILGGFSCLLLPKNSQKAAE